MKKILILVVSLFALVPEPVAAQPRGGHGMGGLHKLRAGIPPHIADKLGISDAQQKKIQQLAFDSNEKLIDLEAELKRARLEMQRLLAADNPNQSAVLSQVDKVTRAEGEVRKNRMGLMLKIREVLGPDLWRKVEAKMHERRGKKRRDRGEQGAPPAPAPNAR